MIEAEELARMFHETYERLAPSFGYKTREASAKPWAEVPENNRQLMTAVCATILDHIFSRTNSTDGPQILDLHPGLRDKHLTDPIPNKPPGDFGPEHIPPEVAGLPKSKMQAAIEKGRQ